MQLFTVEHIEQELLESAWPVVRMAGEHFDSIWWQSEAEELIGRGGGVLAARGPDSAVYGIATYEPVKKRDLGQVLAVRTLITLDLARKAPARRALCSALDLVAGALGCTSVALPRPAKARRQHRAGPI